MPLPGLMGAFIYCLAGICCRLPRERTIKNKKLMARICFIRNPLVGFVVHEYY